MDKILSINEGEVTERVDLLNRISSTMASDAECSAIIGISGVGKTTAVTRLLTMYPQVIIHKEYKGKPLSRTQLVWLKVECPHDGSIKGFCQTCFNAIDRVMGTNYYKKYGNYRYSSANMMVDLSTIFAIHGLGILVIDEIQFLVHKRTRSEALINFLVSLINTTGIPTILIGTPRASCLFNTDFKFARRTPGPPWDRLRENDGNWEFFIETMWKYQWVKNFTPLSTEIKEVLYELSQGITGVVVYLYVYAQIRAIVSGVERLTVGLLRDVAKKELQRMSKIVTAIRENNYDALAAYADVTLDIDEAFYNASKDITTLKRVEKMYKKQKNENALEQEEYIENTLYNFSENTAFEGISTNKIIKILKQVVKENKNKTQKEWTKLAMQKLLNFHSSVKNNNKHINKNNNTEGRGLIDIYEKCQQKKLSIYDELKLEGFIGDDFEFG